MLTPRDVEVILFFAGLFTFVAASISSFDWLRGERNSWAALGVMIISAALIQAGQLSHQMYVAAIEMTFVLAMLFLGSRLVTWAAIPPNISK